MYIDVWWILKAFPPWWQWVVKTSQFLKVLQMKYNPWNASELITLQVQHHEVFTKSKSDR